MFSCFLTSIGTTDFVVYFCLPDCTGLGILLFFHWVASLFGFRENDNVEFSISGIISSILDSTLKYSMCSKSYEVWVCIFISVSVCRGANRQATLQEDKDFLLRLTLLAKSYNFQALETRFVSLYVNIPYIHPMHYQHSHSNRSWTWRYVFAGRADSCSWAPTLSFRTSGCWQYFSCIILFGQG